MVPDVTKKAEPATKAEFDELIQGAGIDDMELRLDREKTNRQEKSYLYYSHLSFIYTRAYDIETCGWRKWCDSTLGRVSLW